MFLCYIDESGVASIPGNTSHYILAGLTIPISKWKYCEKEIRSIKQKYGLVGKEIHTGWILGLYKHQNEIPNFDKLDWKQRRLAVTKLRTANLLRLQKGTNPKSYHRTKKTYRKSEAYIHLNKQERNDLILAIAKKIGSWNFARLFAECIDKTFFDPTQERSVEEQAFEQVVSRFEHYLKISTRSFKYKQYGMLIHDSNQTVEKNLTDLMKSFHYNGTLWTKIHNIIETPLFVNSELTSMIQIADVCSYALRRYCENNETHLFGEIYKIADKKDGRTVGVRHWSENTCNCEICTAH